MVKISFLGDVMSGANQISICLRNGYEKCFKNIEGIFSDSDLVVANLETPLSRDQKKYSKERYSFCAPAELARAMKKIFPRLLLLTANNHCMDRGFEGLQETIEILDEEKILHTGTSLLGKMCFEVTIQDAKICFFNYTYDTNAWSNGNFLSRAQKRSVCLLQPEIRQKKNKFGKVGDWIGKVEQRFSLFQRNLPVYETYRKKSPHIKALKRLIAEKSKESICVGCIHVGGQYNETPTKYSRYVAKELIESGLSFSIQNHEHRIQKAEFIQGKAVFYSLGNFVGTNGVIDAPYNKDAEFSICVNVYIDPKRKSRNRYSVVFFIEKIDQESGVVFPFPVLTEISESKDLAYRQLLQRKIQMFTNILNLKNVPDENGEFFMKEEK